MRRALRAALIFAIMFLSQALSVVDRPAQAATPLGWQAPSPKTYWATAEQACRAEFDYWPSLVTNGVFHGADPTVSWFIAACEWNGTPLPSNVYFWCPSGSARAAPDRCPDNGTNSQDREPHCINNKADFNPTATAPTRRATPRSPAR